MTFSSVFNKRQLWRRVSTYRSPSQTLTTSIPSDSCSLSTASTTSLSSCSTSLTSIASESSIFSSILSIFTPSSLLSASNSTSSIESTSSSDLESFQDDGALNNCQSNLIDFLDETYTTSSSSCSNPNSPSSYNDNLTINIKESSHKNKDTKHVTFDDKNVEVIETYSREDLSEYSSDLFWMNNDYIFFYFNKEYEEKYGEGIVNDNIENQLYQQIVESLISHPLYPMNLKYYLQSGNSSGNTSVSSSFSYDVIYPSTDNNLSITPSLSTPSLENDQQEEVELTYEVIHPSETESEVSNDANFFTSPLYFSHLSFSKTIPYTYYYHGRNQERKRRKRSNSYPRRPYYIN